MNKVSRPVFPRQPSAPVDSLDSIDPVISRIYANRDITHAGELDYSLAKLLPIGSLERVTDAVELLLEHRQKHVMIIGDFDADGATSTALVMRCLKGFGFSNVGYLVPNRFEFGYGLTPEIVDVAAARNPDLLVTVDNGVSSIAGVDRANELAIKVLVTDHHLPGPLLPSAAVIVNPNLKENHFKSGNLAGVGVAFYLMAALGRRMQEDGLAGAAKIPAQFLDLVALGTVADVVALDHNNRILVNQGLQRIRSRNTIAGIQALLCIAKRDVTRIASTDLGFAVGPRLNAAGRLDDMSIGIECLLTDDLATAEKLAADLDRINRERRTLETTMRDQAFTVVDKMDATSLPPCVCVYDPSWHQGIVGLVASRVKDRCHRPVIAFAQERDGLLKGSARSIAGVHIRDLLEAISTSNPSLIEKFGGHAMAAGLTLPEKNLRIFKDAASGKLREMYPAADFSGAIYTDGALPDTSLTLRFAKLLRDSGPWGAGFPEPLFSGRFTVSDRRVVGENHLKLQVQPESGGASLAAIAFNQSAAETRGVVELAYRLDVNEFRGIESPQLVVEQIVNVS